MSNAEQPSDQVEAMRLYEEQYGDTAVERYMEQNLDRYASELTTAIEADPETKSATIARPWNLHTSEVEKEGRTKIFEKLKAQFLPQYPDRVMIRNFWVEYNGQKAKELDPPAMAFEVIRFFEPQTGSGPSGGDVRVSLVH